jgi:DNA invertase Pin-like site-specific DNA recombinase
MKVVAYIRVSGDKQELENQRFGINEFCKSAQLKLDEVFEDTKSGKVSWRDRDLFNLLNSLERGDYLILPELSRLSRSVRDIFDFLAAAARQQITVRVLKEGFVIDDSLQTTVLVTVFGLAAQIEREFNRQRTREALQRKRAEGVRLGRPAGSKNKSSKLAGKDAEVMNLIKLKVPATVIAKLMNVHVSTVRRFKKSIEGDLS